MENKKIIIVHGWGSNPNADWHPWLKEKLQEKGYEVIIPEMPNSDEPEIERWVYHLTKSVGKIDKNTYFIGHSIGCQTIMRYLETLPEKIKIGKIIFVAGWFNLKNLESKEEKRIAKPWLTKPINFSKIMKKTNDITVFLSTNEPYGCVKENERKFKDSLNAKVIIEKNKGHFTPEYGVTEVPEVLNEILKH